MKRLLFAAFMTLAFASCSDWIDSPRSHAVLTVTEEGAYRVDKFLGDTLPVSFEIGGLIGTANAPAYSRFLLSINGQIVEYKVGYHRNLFDSESYYVRLYRGDACVDLFVYSKVERGAR